MKSGGSDEFLVGSGRPEHCLLIYSPIFHRPAGFAAEWITLWAATLCISSRFFILLKELGWVQIIPKYLCLMLMLKSLEKLKCWAGIKQYLNQLWDKSANHCKSNEIWKQREIIGNWFPIENFPSVLFRNYSDGFYLDCWKGIGVFVFKTVWLWAFKDNPIPPALQYWCHMFPVFPRSQAQISSWCEEILNKNDF